MDPNHRSCIAFVKICSGKFERNAPYRHVRSGKTLKFAAPTAFMAQKKSIVDEAYPGHSVGIPDTGNFKIGDTLTTSEELHFKGLPSFSPEMFKYIENTDPMKSKQLDKGIQQLMDRGVAYASCDKSDDQEALEAFKRRKHQFMATDREGRDVFLADSSYVLQMAQTDFPKIQFFFSSEF